MTIRIPVGEEVSHAHPIVDFAEDLLPTLIEMSDEVKPQGPVNSSIQ
jgi:hypothetical protein